MLRAAETCMQLRAAASAACNGPCSAQTLLPLVQRLSWQADIEAARAEAAARAGERNEEAEKAAREAARAKRLVSCS